MILLSSSDRPRPSKAYALVKFFKRTSTTLSISSTVVYSCAGWPTFSPRGRRRRALGLVTSVKVVEKRVSEEVAIGQAAMGGSFAGSASIAAV